MYNESAKKATIKYMREKRENLNVNLPLGAKDRYKAHPRNCRKPTAEQPEQQDYQLQP